MGCDWWWRVFGERNCRLLDALKQWLQGGDGLRFVVPCYCGMQVQIARRLRVAARWSWVAIGGDVLQNGRRLITVGSRWSWVASGCAVLLGNASADC